MQITDHNYMISALAEAYYSGMDLADVLRAACDTEDMQEFDRKIQDVSLYWGDVPDKDAF